MRMICLETTDRQGSVALYSGRSLVAAEDLPDSQRTAQTFAPTIKRIVCDAGWRFQNIDRVAVASGPGSFTGLRIGVTAAKTLAFLSGAELLGVNTLDVIAWQYFNQGMQGRLANGCLHVALDAQRSQVFTASYASQAELPLKFVLTQSTRILDVDVWLKMMNPGDVVAGPLLAKLSSELPTGVAMAELGVWRPTATGVGRVAECEFAAGRRDDPFQLVPEYHRLSAAEEKRAAFENQ